MVEQTIEQGGDGGRIAATPRCLPLSNSGQSDNYLMMLVFASAAFNLIRLPKLLPRSARPGRRVFTGRLAATERTHAALRAASPQDSPSR